MLKIIRKQNLHELTSIWFAKTVEEIEYADELN